jgi:hypothetical protein
MDVVWLNEFSYDVFKNPQLFLMCIVYVWYLTIHDQVVNHILQYFDEIQFSFCSLSQFETNILFHGYSFKMHLHI